MDTYVEPSSPSNGIKRSSSTDSDLNSPATKKSRPGPISTVDNPKTPTKQRVTIAKEPKTPKTPKTPKAPRAPKAPKIKSEDDGEPGSSKKAQATTGKSTPKGIPQSWEEASTADRLLVQMKDAGESQQKVMEMWERETGVKPGKSTLSVRYSRVKANLERLEGGDDVKLLDAVTKWENEKFQRISALMVEARCKKYSHMLLKKELTKIQDAQKAGTWVPSAVEAAHAEDDNDEASQVEEPELDDEADAPIVENGEGDMDGEDGEVDD